MMLHKRYSKDDCKNFKLFKNFLRQLAFIKLYPRTFYQKSQDLTEAKMGININSHIQTKFIVRFCHGNKITI